MMNEFLIIILLLGLAAFLVFLVNKNKSKVPKVAFPEKWKQILTDKVHFYSSLNIEDKKRFEYEIQTFLLNTRITAYETTVEELDKILIAASAVIPVFGFDHWTYHNLDEVILYPNNFNENHETSSDSANILGMVGTGYMNRKMILSKSSLRKGFGNASDKKNVGIHEFTHLIDMADGTADGIPEAIVNKEFTLPWLDLIKQKIDEIADDESDINPYATYNEAEFLSVVSEYFFERPKLLKSKHPQLYQALEIIFNQKMLLGVTTFALVEVVKNINIVVEVYHSQPFSTILHLKCLGITFCNFA